MKMKRHLRIRASRVLKAAVCLDIGGGGCGLLCGEKAVVFAGGDGRGVEEEEEEEDNVTKDS